MMQIHTSVDLSEKGKEKFAKKLVSYLYKANENYRNSHLFSQAIAEFERHSGRKYSQYNFSDRINIMGIIRCLASEFMSEDDKDRLIRKRFGKKFLDTV